MPLTKLGERFDAALWASLQKGERRKVVKAREKRRKFKTRREVVDFVWQRENATCERCKRAVKRYVHPVRPDRGHCNERIPKSKGGDPLDATNVELVCNSCHLPGGAHAPTPERQKRLNQLRCRKAG